MVPDSYLNQAPLLFFKHFSLYITYLFNRDDRLSVITTVCLYLSIFFTQPEQVIYAPPSFLASGTKYVISTICCVPIVSADQI